jgi:predicted transcriptional regulator
MNETGYLLSLKHSLWHTLAGTRGGMSRIRIIGLLRERPYNMNNISKSTGLDYKTVQHHIKVLLNEKIITSDDTRRYGSMYFLSPLFEQNMYLFDEIMAKVGENKINTGGKK